MQSKRCKSKLRHSEDYDEVQNKLENKLNVDEPDNEGQENKKFLSNQESCVSLARDSSTGSILYDTQDEKTKKSNFSTVISRLKSSSDSNNQKFNFKEKSDSVIVEPEEEEQKI